MYVCAYQDICITSSSMIPEDLPKRAALNTQITTAELRNYTRTVNSLTQREKQCLPRSDLGLDRTRTTHCTLHLTQVNRVASGSGGSSRVANGGPRMSNVVIAGSMTAAGRWEMRCCRHSELSMGVDRLGRTLYYSDSAVNPTYCPSEMNRTQPEGRFVGVN